MKKIGALILTYNEEQRIRDCLESVSWVDEIVIVDSYSTDRTVEICQQYTSKIFSRSFDDFSAQRNFGLEKINTDWVLVIDADERVTPELRAEILKEISSPRHDAFFIPRKNYFLGKWIKYCGWYPDYTLRLFKKTDKRYTKRVHETIDYENTGKFKNNLIHLTYKDLSHYMHKMEKYATLWAEEKYASGKKVTLLKIIFRSIFEFIKLYFLKLGILSGSPGFVLSVVSTYYTFFKYIKLWEKYYCTTK